MAPVSPVSDALTAAVLHPTRTLAQPLGNLLARQVVATVTTTPETTEETASGNDLSGGAIAGIVIGSIAGFFLLLWIVRSCGMWSRPNDWAEKEDHRRHRGRSPGARHQRRSQHRYHHETSRSHHRHPSYEINEIRYSQPAAVYDKRRMSSSPVPPANVYRSSRSRTRY